MQGSDIKVNQHKADEEAGESWLCHLLASGADKVLQQEWLRRGTRHNNNLRRALKAASEATFLRWLSVGCGDFPWTVPVLKGETIAWRGKSFYSLSAWFVTLILFNLFVGMKWERKGGGKGRDVIKVLA
jgi:hypothetical protein